MEVSLKEYTEARLASLEKAALIVVGQMEKRLDGLNHVREQLREQAATFHTKGEHDIFFKYLKEKLDTIDKNLSDLHDFKIKLETKASQKAVNFATTMGIIGVILGLITVLVEFLKK